MAKLSRVFQKLFGGDGDQTHYGQFASRATLGAPVFTKDPASIQQLSAFTQNGFLQAINSSNKAPFLEDVNGLMLLAFYQIAYMFQSGIPEWEVSTEYDTGSIVRKAGTAELYGSTIDGNIGNALPNQTANGAWNYLNPASVPAGTITAFAGTTAPFGTLVCDGTAYSQTALPSLFAAIGSNWNTFNGAADPGGGNFRVPDLRGLALMGVGHGNGFSARTLAQLVGEESHVLTIPEMPNHDHPLKHDYAFYNPAQNAPGFGIHGVGSLNEYAVFGALEKNGTGTINAPDNTLTTGGSGAHNNMQPTAAINWVIKT